MLEGCSQGPLPFHIPMKLLFLITEMDALVSTSMATSSSSTVIITFMGAALGADNMKSE